MKPEDVPPELIDFLRDRDESLGDAEFLAELLTRYNQIRGRRAQAKRWARATPEERSRIGRLRAEGRWHPGGRMDADKR